MEDKFWPAMLGTTREWFRITTKKMGSWFNDSWENTKFGLNFSVVKIINPSKGCHLNPKRWWIDTFGNHLGHLFEGAGVYQNCEWFMVMYVSTPPFKTSIQNRPSNQNPTCTGLQLCPPHDQKPRNPRVNCHPNGCYHAHRQPPVKVKICENLLGIFGGEVKLLGDLASCFFWGWRAKDAKKHLIFEERASRMFLPGKAMICLVQVGQWKKTLQKTPLPALHIKEHMSYCLLLTGKGDNSIQTLTL